MHRADRVVVGGGADLRGRTGRIDRYDFFFKRPAAGSYRPAGIEKHTVPVEYQIVAGTHLVYKHKG